MFTYVILAEFLNLRLYRKVLGWIQYDTKCQTIPKQHWLGQEWTKLKHIQDIDFII